MKTIISILIIHFLFLACTDPKKATDVLKIDTLQSAETRFKQPPTAVVKAIEENFRGSLPYEEGIDSLMEHLQHFGISANSILWGQSTCVDDITNTKDKLIHPEIKGPFNFGGLAGLPFTGITGLNAFAHHVPEDGTAILFVGPHIGYDEREGWGKIIRHDQHEASSCCGALSAALSRLQKGELKLQSPKKEDYQENVIEQLAYEHREEILSSQEPLITLTKLTYLEAEKQMSAYASKVTERHFKYAVIVVGIIINTDFEFPDYLWIDHLAILDIKNNVWLEGEKFHE